MNWKEQTNTCACVSPRSKSKKHFFGKKDNSFGAVQLRISVSVDQIEEMIHCVFVLASLTHFNLSPEIKCISIYPWFSHRFSFGQFWTIIIYLLFSV